MEEGRDTGGMVLVEATANQVNQFGGYTGMRPDDFFAYATRLAKKAGLPGDRWILGGDHLGPLTWQNEPERTAMANAVELVRQFAAAGFGKLHLDTSMRVATDDPTKRLPDETIAARAAVLCAAAEAACDPSDPPVYIIGSEVPIPGGATENEDSLTVTSPSDLLHTVEAFRTAFMAAGLSDAWQRVIGVVVQPGVEFADNTIIRYDSDAARALTDCARTLPGMVLEGHSTDYQPTSALTRMREDGVAILKVGPALTFALREALFSLEAMERILYPFAPEGGYSRFAGILEQTLMERPGHWRRYYQGTPQEVAYARKYSLSDRCRYYLEDAAVQRAIRRLLGNINAAELPFGLLSQYFPAQRERILESPGRITAESLVKEHIKAVIRTYTSRQKRSF